VAGSLKNALDWTVGSGDFVNKPVALITAATGGENAHAAMRLTLTAMNAILVEGAMLTIPFVKAMVAGGAIKETHLITQLQSLVTSFVRFIASDSPDKAR
jgi:NAD(P)H-dependent FMN reductase